MNSSFMANDHTFGSASSVADSARLIAAGGGAGATDAGINAASLTLNAQRIGGSADGINFGPIMAGGGTLGQPVDGSGSSPVAAPPRQDNTALWLLGTGLVAAAILYFRNSDS